MRTKHYDFLIIDAGIVGLKVEHEIRQREPAKSIAVLDIEASLGVYASGRSGGIFHCGICYGIDMFKAKVCSRAASGLMAFAELIVDWSGILGTCKAIA